MFCVFDTLSLEPVSQATNLELAEKEAHRLGGEIRGYVVVQERPVIVEQKKSVQIVVNTEPPKVKEHKEAEFDW